MAIRNTGERIHSGMNLRARLELHTMSKLVGYGFKKRSLFHNVLLESLLI